MGRNIPTDGVALQEICVVFHSEALGDNQLNLLPRLGPFATEYGFYLGGGTAVALYYGHRKSIDFDLFTGSAIDDPLVLADRARNSGLDISKPRVSPGTLNVLVEDVRVSFFEYRYPVLTHNVLLPEFGLEMASLDDLACMKLAAIAQRGSRKDFIDMYVLTTRHISIRDALELYQKKYQTSEIGHVLLGLTYFDDAEREPSPVMLEELDWGEVKARFEAWAREIAS